MDAPLSSAPIVYPQIQLRALLRLVLGACCRPMDVASCSAPAATPIDTALCSTPRPLSFPRTQGDRYARGDHLRMHPLAAPVYETLAT